MTESDSRNPLCYTCRHRGTIPGNCHSRCNHPVVSDVKDPLGEIFSILGGPITPVGILQAAALEISAHPHGVRSGWFSWPHNFDPVWLKTCKGYDPKEEQHE